MANVKISALTSASTPLAGTEVLPIVQSSATVKVAVADLTAGRAISALSLNSLTVGLGAGSVATNTAVGVSALAANTSGAYNTAIGNSALIANTTASESVAIGYLSSGSKTTGEKTVSVGSESLRYNTTGSYNTALGQSALYSNTTASNNTAVGFKAGYPATGDGGTFIGSNAGQAVTSGTQNTFVGLNAGYFVTTGSNNTVLGGFNGNQGGLDIRTSSNYIVLSDGNGNPNLYLDNNQNIFVPRTYLNTTATAANMVVGSNGGYARSTSALKYKQDIRELESMDINSLRPVRYKSKCENDDQTKDHLGLIADEAADAGFEELVTRGADGEVEGFQYERLTVVLLKAMQTLKAEFDAYKASHP